MLYAYMYNNMLAYLHLAFSPALSMLTRNLYKSRYFKNCTVIFHFNVITATNEEEQH
jgi:hypothetical protein